jgi:hypothetical protein
MSSSSSSTSHPGRKRTASGTAKKATAAAPPLTLEDLPFIDGYPDVAGHGIRTAYEGARAYVAATVKLPAGTYVARADDARVASIAVQSPPNVRVVMYEEDDAANYENLVTKKQKKSHSASVPVKKKLPVPVRWIVTTRVIRVGEELRIATTGSSPAAQQEASVSTAQPSTSTTSAAPTASTTTVPAPAAAAASAAVPVPLTTTAAAAAAGVAKHNKHKPVLPLLGSAWIVVDPQPRLAPPEQHQAPSSAATDTSPAISPMPAPSRQVSALSTGTAASSRSASPAPPTGMAAADASPSSLFVSSFFAAKQVTPTNSPAAAAVPVRSSSFFGGWVPGKVTYTPRK